MGPIGTGDTRFEINITPFIDVLLVLLVIFMLQAGRTIMNLQVPQESHAGPGESKGIVLELMNSGGYRINTRLVPAESLVTALHTIYDVRPDKVLFVKSGGERRYGELIAAADLARGAGVEVVGLLP